MPEAREEVRLQRWAQLMIDEQVTDKDNFVMNTPEERDQAIEDIKTACLEHCHINNLKHFMKEEYKSVSLHKNENLHRFELNIGGSCAFIEYRESADRITLVHTGVDPALEGKGAATAVIEKTLDYIEKNNLKLIPLCPLVMAYLKRHPEWKRILAEGVKNV